MGHKEPKPRWAPHQPAAAANVPHHRGCLPPPKPVARPIQRGQDGPAPWIAGLDQGNLVAPVAPPVNL